MHTIFDNRVALRVCFVAHGLLALGAAGCDPPPTLPPSPCATILCPPDKVCAVRDCVGGPCTPVAQCVPKPEPSACAAISCPVDTVCVVEDVVCVREPCPPVARCVPREPTPTSSCAAVLCLTGNRCEVRQVQCARPPCPLIAECVPNPTN